MLINDPTVPEATEADLVNASRMLIQTASGTKQGPGDLFAPASILFIGTKIKNTDVTTFKASVGATGWYYSGGNGSHSSYKIAAGECVKIINSGNIIARFGIFPATFVEGDKTNGAAYEAGTKIGTIDVGNEYVINASASCVLVTNTVDGGGNANEVTIVKTNERLDAVSNPFINSSDLCKYKSSLGPTGWYHRENYPKHTSFRLFKGSKALLTNTGTVDAFYGIFPSSFADTDFENNDSFPAGFAGRVVLRVGETAVIEANDDVVVVMNAVDGGGNANEFTANVLYGDYFIIKEELDEIVDGFTKTIDTTSLTYFKGSLGQSAWNLHNDTARHCSVKLLAGQNVSLENTGAIDAFYAFFPASYSDSDKTNGEAYAAGYSGRIVLEHGESADISPDVDCVLVMNTVDGVNNANEFSIAITQAPLFELINEKTGVNTDKKKSYDSANLTVYKASLGNGFWYMPSPGANPRHCSITCKAGQYLELTNTGAIDAFYALFPASFVDGDMTGGADLPAGYGRIVLGTGKTIKITILEDSVLVMNVVDGGNNANSFHADVFDLSSDKINLKSSTQFCRLKVAEWNVGHFAMGAAGDTTIPPEEKAEKQAAFRTLMNSVGVDVLLLCENSVNFCTDGTKANDAVWNCFKQINDGPKNGYNMNSVLTNGLQFVSRKVNAYVNQDGAGGRYFIDCKYSIKGREVHIIATHNTWGDKTTAMAQYNELITYCADFEYVILAADFNAGSQWDYGMKDVVAPLFHSSGFSSAWCDYMGAVDTYPDSEYQPANLDNIFVKGFSVTNSQVIDSSINLSDHKMITCDLVME